jgi:hypothetical protein
MKKLELNNIKKTVYKLLILPFDFTTFLSIIIEAQKDKNSSLLLDRMH